MTDAAKPSQTAKVTLSDVAQDVGVSVSTVSRTLSGAPGISGSVRKRIQESAERLGYSGAIKSHNIVMAVDMHTIESSASEFVQALQRGIELQATAMGLEMSIQHVVLRDAPQISLNTDADGYLLVSLQEEDIVSRLSANGVPAVIVNGRDQLMRLDAMAPANRAGGFIGARHLIELGHQRILTLEHSKRPTIRDRMLGSRRAREAAKLAEDPSLALDMPEMRADVAYQCVKERLQARGGQPDFTAIQCCNDASALGAIAALSEAGLSVPEDVSVIGFDDVPAAALNSIPLTTLHVDAADLGVRSVRQLINRIHDPSQLVTYTETAVALIPRNSTGPVPA